MITPRHTRTVPTPSRGGSLTGEDELGGRDALLDVPEREVEPRVVGDMPEAAEQVADERLELLLGGLHAREPFVEVLGERLRALGVHVAAVDEPGDELEVLPALDCDVDLLRQAVLVQDESC